MMWYVSGELNSLPEHVQLPSLWNWSSVDAHRPLCEYTIQHATDAPCLDAKTFKVKTETVRGQQGMNSCKVWTQACMNYLLTNTYNTCQPSGRHSTQHGLHLSTERIFVFTNITPCHLWPLAGLHAVICQHNEHKLLLLLMLPLSVF